MDGFKIQLIYVVICFLEAWLEQAVIKLKSHTVPDYKLWDKREHTRSAVYACAVAAALVFSVGIEKRMILVFLSMLAIRRLFFDFTLKHLRDIPFKMITGNHPVDSFSRKIFGEKGGIKEAIVYVVLIALFNFFYSIF